MERRKLFAGFALLVWAFIECLDNELRHDIWNDPAFAVFMCFGDLLLLLWMWGVSMHVWRLAGIDFVQLLDLQGTEIENNKTPESLVYNSATNLSLLFLVVFICYNHAIRNEFPWHLTVAHLLPLGLVIYYLWRCVSPFESRGRWLFMLWQVVAAPFYPVFFRDGYIGDLLTSLVRVIVPLSASLGHLLVSSWVWLTSDASKSSIELAALTAWQRHWVYRYIIVPSLTLSPLLIRLMQCLRRSVESGSQWPHFGNAAKYTSAILVITLGTFRPSYRYNGLWILAFVGATIFQFVWDITMDWGIVVWRGPLNSDSLHGDPRGGGLFRGQLDLRSSRLLGQKWLYVTIILSNLALRFAWTLTLLPSEAPFGENPNSLTSSLFFHLGPLIAATEVVRRMVWGFLRLEYEQLLVLGVPSASELVNLDKITLSPKPSKDVDETVTAPLESFEKMEVSSSGSDRAAFFGAFSPSLYIAKYYLPEGFLEVLSTHCGLDVAQLPNSRQRLVEAACFGGVVIGFIVCTFMATLRQSS